MLKNLKINTINNIYKSHWFKFNTNKYMFTFIECDVLSKLKLVNTNKSLQVNIFIDERLTVLENGFIK